MSEATDTRGLLGGGTDGRARAWADTVCMSFRADSTCSAAYSRWRLGLRLVLATGDRHHGISLDVYTIFKVIIGPSEDNRCFGWLQGTKDPLYGFLC